MSQGDYRPRQGGPDIPDDLRAASRVLGTAASIRIIRNLHIDGPQTRTDLIASTGFSSGLVGQSLNKLASFDAVTVDPLQGALPARERTYRLNVERLQTLLDVLHSYVMGTTDQ